MVRGTRRGEAMRTPRLEPPRVTVQGTGRPTVTNRLLIQEARTLPWHTHTHTCGEEGHGSNGAAPPGSRAVWQPA